jgi:hypothetical protein
MSRSRYLALVAPLALWTTPVADGVMADIPQTRRLLAEARGRIVTPEQGQRLLAWFTQNGGPQTNGVEQPALIHLGVLAHLTLGDVASAEKLLEDANAGISSAAETPQATADVALVAGDAQAALDGIQHIIPVADTSKPDTQQSRSVYRELLRNVGAVFEPIELELADGNPLTLPTPGQPAIVVFWQQAEAPDPEMVAALTAAAATEADVEVTLLAVNSDSQNTRDAVIAAQTGWPDPWQHHLEPRPIRPPLTFRTFEIRHLPAVAVLDRAGALRAVLPADDPRAVYAARAVVRETAGDVPTIIPVTRDGQRPALRGLEAPVASAEEPPAEQAAPAPPATDEPTATDSAEADKLLQTAHSMRRMRSYKRARELYEEIIEKYPGTPQAAEAREYLGRLPR